MLPSVIERTTGADYPDALGYVRSTMAGMYAGTYPDVDHEFQIKGRIAWGSRVDLAVVRRMLELRLPAHARRPHRPLARPLRRAAEWRPRVPRTAQQHGPDRERRDVPGHRQHRGARIHQAYVARTKDFEWLRRNIADIEGAASGIEEYIDPLGRLWGDVYYEDQVIKDGRETMAQALAVRSFELLAQLEDLLGRVVSATRYRAVRDGLAASLVSAVARGVVG